MPDEETTIVRPITAQGTKGLWAPSIGPETLSFLDDIVPSASRQDISESAVSILSNCLPPNENPGEETGLVVGYVQSGKTMSFETVTTLARDNGYQMVIVIAGVSNPLLDQSIGRLTKDLRLNDASRGRRWIQFQNPSDEDAVFQAIRDVLEDWQDETLPQQHKKTVLITVLKQHTRLRNLTNLIRRVDVSNVPVLIIDDEADQASLNTEVDQQDESTTYSRLMELRRALPSHSYLQYTATPQAPLLINIVDSLSPNFVHVLEPGEEYVGGQDFFADNLSLVRVIPPLEVPTRNNPINEPPTSLLNALRVFMVGVTIGIIESDNSGNRSMLIHPSHLTAHHQEYYNWARAIFEEWKRLLKLPGDDPDRQNLIEDLRIAYEDLQETSESELPEFEELEDKFRFAFRNTRILEVNARGGRTPEVDWRSAYGWILVGGQAMDRGFTVEGLTVTYMPRGIGVGNADTIQQRARFFGYKRKYVGFCRVYLEQGTLDAFQNYVTHEEYMRKQLKDVQHLGLSLNEWKRAFILDTGLRACRTQVIEFDYLRGRFSNNWVVPKVILGSDQVLETNRDVAENFLSQLNFEEDEGHADRTETQRHLVAKGVPLRNVLEGLLLPTRITGTVDSQRHTGLMLQLSCALDEFADETCTVYRMSHSTRRRRGVDSESGEITELFQGAAPVTPIERRGEVYPGDRDLRDDGNVTVQIHMIDLTEDDQLIAEQVAVVAVWVPRRLEQAWVVQNQPSQSET